MKRALALLLALACLLTHAALADSLSVSFAADEEEMTAYFTAYGMADAETLSQGLTELLNKSTVSGWFDRQNPEGSLALQIDGETLLDISFTEDLENNRILYASSLFPGYAVAVVFENLAELSDHRTEEEQAAWLELVNGPVKEKVVSFLLDRAGQTSVGSFMGDAYESGTYSTELTLRDSDLYVLAVTLKPELSRWAELSGSGEEFWDSLYQDLLQAAVADEDLYRVRLIYDERFTLKALSLTVEHLGTQVATLSLGLESPDSVRYVLGFGILEQVYYLSGQLTTVENGLRGSVELWHDVRKAGFPATAAAEDNRLTALDFDLAYESTGAAEGKLAYGLSMKQTGRPALQERGELLLQESGAQLSSSLTLEGREAPLLKTVCVTDGTAERPAWPEDLKVIGLEDMGSEDFAQTMQNASEQLGLKMVRLMPTQLLLYLVQFIHL